jgi:hypothetical protein
MYLIMRIADRDIQPGALDVQLLMAFKVGPLRDSRNIYKLI